VVFSEVNSSCVTADVAKGFILWFIVPGSRKFKSTDVFGVILRATSGGHLVD